jgi:hypothetical protein
LGGGTLATAGFGEGLGVLTLNANSTINFGSSASALVFGNSSASIWNSAATLTIANWTGSPLGDGADQIFFGTDSTGLGANLASIRFLNPEGFDPGIYEAQILDTGEIVAVPEPAAVSMMIGGLGVLLGMRRRRNR